MIRSFQARDYPARLRLIRALSSELDASEAELVGFDNDDAAAGRDALRVVWEEEGQVLGFAQQREFAYFHAPGRRQIQVLVDAGAHRRGIGRALHQHVTQEAAARGATEYVILAPQSVGADAFAQAVGYRAVDDELRMRLEPVVSPGDPAAARFRMAEQGVEIATLAELQRSTPDWLDRYYALGAELQRSIPVRFGGASVPDRESFVRAELEAPGVRLEATWFAVHGGSWVGMTEIRTPSPERGQQQLTGVIDPYRRRGIARALKEVGIAWAAEEGLAALSTNTNAANEAMRRLNESLGFRVAERWITWRASALRGGGAFAGDAGGAPGDW